MGIYFVITLLLINGTAIFLFFLSVSPKIKAKNLSSIMICLGINLIISPAAFLIGGIADYAGVAANYGAYFAGESATAPPLVSRALYFLGGFLFIQGIPLLILLAAFWKFARAKKIKQV
ncbi:MULTISPECIES: hypothetical protein [Bacillus cereus group]|uniref:Uncharacterized protein n=2 Tax=Bacillus cereus group TaxID=86661 RepID=A0A6H0TRS2_BACTU|nr:MULTISPECIES: hypothetical protein [Bacillus cereus group]KAA0787672.1 hypothetical protein DN394_17420 [Bacillus sp. BB081]MED2790132.1 hypothetical protein [Bacillus wiedmannii]PEA77433.1 hypothetical protein CON92_14395 [Bacillus wiedmannii]PEG11760.1 hypothetical protein CON96_03135 [Bacillus wiedmannii]PEI80442.1 hypothetical protein CN905_05765 [Bacillus wiedmannii]